MKDETKKAFEFLCERWTVLILCKEMTRQKFMFMLMDFMERHGEDAVIALAGFYMFVINSNKHTPDSKRSMLYSTFTHDLFDLGQYMLPRSSDYAYFWKKYEPEALTTNEASFLNNQTISK